MSPQAWIYLRILFIVLLSRTKQRHYVTLIYSTRRLTTPDKTNTSDIWYILNPNTLEAEVRVEQELWVDFSKFQSVYLSRQTSFKIKYVRRIKSESLPRSQINLFRQFFGIDMWKYDIRRYQSNTEHFIRIPQIFPKKKKKLYRFLKATAIINTSTYIYVTCQLFLGKENLSRYVYNPHIFFRKTL